MYAAVIENLNLDVPVIAWAAEEGVDDDVLRERLEEAADKQLAEKQEAFGIESFAQVQRQVLLSTIDSKWREHLLCWNICEALLVSEDTHNAIH